MASYCVGCDNIVGGEKKIISKVAKVLKDAGHNVEELSVGPNYVQSKGLSNSSKGKIAVFLVGGSDIGTYVDFKSGLTNGYYHYKYIWFAFCSWTATTWITCSELKTRGLVRAHDDNFSSQSSIAPYLGKSADYFFSKNKDKMNYVCGQSPEELAKKILGDAGGNSDSKSSSSPIRNAIKEVLYGWNGDAECVLRDDTVHIRKIPSPTKATLSLIEDVNVHFDNISLTDIIPDTPNKLVIEWNNDTYIIKDDDRINRFGEKKQTIKADLAAGEDITDFAYREWNKLLKDDGRVLECKVDGGPEWRNGQWVRVYMPSFKLDGFMYLTKVSHDDNIDWTCNLRLVDYPPDLGTEPTQKSTDDSDSTDDIESGDS